MKFKLLLLLSCTVLMLAAQAQLLTTAVEREAQKFAKALMGNDYEKVLAYTHDRVITVMGGREAALGLMKKSMEEMKSKGFGVEDTKIGAPQQPQQIGAWTLSLVSETLTLRMPGGKAQQESWLLGISGDGGKTWKFIDLGPLSEDQLFNVFPEFKGQFKMPAKKPAVAEKTP